VSTHPNGVHLDVGNARINGGSLDVGNVFEDTTQLVEDPLIAMIPENIVENHIPNLLIVFRNFTILCKLLQYLTVVVIVTSIVSVPQFN